MRSFRFRWATAAALSLAAACHDGNTGPNGGIAAGESFAVTGAQSVALEPGDNSGHYVAVLVNTGTTAGSSERYSLRGSGIVQPAPAAAPLRQPSASANDERALAPASPQPDRAFESASALNSRPVSPRHAR
jgi:hypothetical protein